MRPRTYCNIVRPIDKMHGGPVIGGIASLDTAARYKLMQRRTPIDFPVIVRTKTSPNDARAVHYAQLPGNRVGTTLFEPAIGTRADTRQNDTFIIGIAQHTIYTPFPPERQHTSGISAPDIN